MLLNMERLTVTYFSVVNVVHDIELIAFITTLMVKAVDQSTASYFS